MMQTVSLVGHRSEVGLYAFLEDNPLGVVLVRAPERKQGRTGSEVRAQRLVSWLATNLELALPALARGRTTWSAKG
jgi:hypothetical protein